jgi:hypothetical protein
MPKNLCILVRSSNLVIDLAKRLNASFNIQLNEQERLTFSSFEEKSDLSGENVVAQLQRIKGEDWETVGSIELYRAPDGIYKQLPESK